MNKSFQDFVIGNLYFPTFCQMFWHHQGVAQTSNLRDSPNKSINIYLFVINPGGAKIFGKTLSNIYFQPLLILNSHFIQHYAILKRVVMG